MTGNQSMDGKFDRKISNKFPSKSCRSYTEDLCTVANFTLSTQLIEPNNSYTKVWKPYVMRFSVFFKTSQS